MLAAVQVAYGTIDESVRIQEVPVPTPGEGHVLVRVGGSTLNRKDLFALADLSGPGIRRRPPLPHVNGTDVWGWVDASGPGVQGWTSGDRVAVYAGLWCGSCEWCLEGETSACLRYGVLGEQVWGGHAQYVVVPAANLERVAADVPDAVLACAGGAWLTAWRALITVAKVTAGESVAIVGASGGVGTGAIAIARVSGCRVIAVVGDHAKADKAIAMGAHEAVLYEDGLADRVRTLTGGRGVDVALDTVGAATWRQTIGSLARFGRMTICGATSGDTPSISIREIYQSHRRILGAPLGSRAEFRQLLTLLTSGALTPIVHATVPLKLIHDGLWMLARRDAFGKIAIRVAS